ncbi:MAG: HD domain-containing protein [Spirochaetales bacterium]|nr:HD domain-containing protein [Spirochaetales bacterium]
MNKIPQENIIDGMVFESPVYLDKNYILLTPEIPVSESLKKNLMKWEYRELETEGPIVGKESLASSDHNMTSAFLDHDAKEKEGIKKARQFYVEILDAVEKIYQRYSRDQHLDLNYITEYIKKMITMIKENHDYILRLPDLDNYNKDYLITHSVKSALLALTIGESIKMPQFKLIELGISALLHEIGMLKLPDNLYNFTRKLSDSEKKALTTHTILGYRLLKDFSLSQDILMGVLQHHERCDGSGYPQQLSAPKISDYAKIISIVCAYDAQISDRPHSASRDGYHTLMEMLKEGAKYDETALRTLLYSISLYPLGSHVILENGSIGVVVHNNKGNPKFPMVKVLIDPDRKPLADMPVIETRDEKGLKIKDILNRDQILKLKAEGLIQKD